MVYGDGKSAPLPHSSELTSACGRSVLARSLVHERKDLPSGRYWGILHRAGHPQAAKAFTTQELSMRFFLSACFFLILAGAALVAQPNSHRAADGVTSPQPPTYDVGAPAAQGIAIADVNGDGNLDLLVADQIGVAVLLGNGDGTFQPAVNYSSGGFDAYSVAVGDVNGDGKPDLVVATFCYDDGCPYDGGGGVGVLLGNGDGTFQPVTVYSNSDWNNFSVALADVNGDGNLDVVVGSGDCTDAGLGCDKGVVSVLLGNGDGSFGQPTFYTPGGLYTQSVVVADVNGDGKPDILAGSCELKDSGCAQAWVAELLGNGNGTFQSPSFYGARGYVVTDLVATDVNGDGNVDLLVANSFGVAELLGNGKGSFETKAVSITSHPYALAAADLNGNGKVDIVLDYECVHPCSGMQFWAIGFALGRGNGNFRVDASTFSSGGINATAVAVGDLNGDGKPDVVVVNYCGGSSKCNGDGTVGVLLSGSLPDPR